MFLAWIEVLHLLSLGVVSRHRAVYSDVGLKSSHGFREMTSSVKVISARPVGISRAFSWISSVRFSNFLGPEELQIYPENLFQDTGKSSKYSCNTQ